MTNKYPSSFLFKCCNYILPVVILLMFSVFCSGPSQVDGKFPRSEIKEHNGVPTLFINGEPNAGMTYMTYNPKEKHYRQFGEIGVNLASFQSTPNLNLYWHDPTVWVSRDSFNFSLLDEEMEMIVRANPNVWIFPRVYVWSPEWWDKENPDELMVYQDGTTERPEQHGSGGGWKTAHPSWSSEKWRKDSAYCLRKFIEHIRSQPYGERVIGYHIASGGTEEWVYWNFGTDFLDYSMPGTEAFRKWLKKKYSTDKALQKAWRNNLVTLETAVVPFSENRINTDLIFFRDPQRSQHVIDYYFFHSEIVAETIAYLSQVAKEATGGTQLVGAFYGYNLELMYWAEYGLVNCGHLALGKLLDCPYVDFFTSPSSYALRNIGDGHSTFNTEIESIKLHGKLWFDENDYRTHLCPPNAGYGRTSDLRASEAIQLRQLSNEIISGAAAWWFDMGAGWYDEEPFMEILNKLNKIGENSINFDRSSTAEIAVVLDEHSLIYTELSSRFTIHLLSQQRLQIARLGAPVDYILLDDIGKARDYKMYIFLDAFRVTPEQKKEIDRLKQRGAKTFVWLYAPGFIGEGLDVKNSENLTGIKINYTKDEKVLNVTLTEKGLSVLSIDDKNVSYGMSHDGGIVHFEPAPENVVGPVFYGDDPDAEVLGILEANNKPGLVRKEVNGIEAYYSAAPNITTSVLQGIAENAGVHIYTRENDAFHANSSFISLHTNKAGQRKIQFPQPTDVYDVYNEKIIAENANEITVHLPEQHTILYFLGSETEWKGTN